MIQYIMWPKTIDAKFRAAYLAKTGEKIQDDPMESEDGLSYMVGSSRVTEQQLSELKVDTDITDKLEDIKTSGNTEPKEWMAQLVNNPV